MAPPALTLSSALVVCTSTTEMVVTKAASAPSPAFQPSLVVLEGIEQCHTQGAPTCAAASESSQLGAQQEHGQFEQLDKPAQAKMSTIAVRIERNAHQGGRGSHMRSQGGPVRSLLHNRKELAWGAISCTAASI